MNRKMSRTANTVDPELADANVKLATVEDEKRELTKANKEKESEVAKLKLQLLEAEKRVRVAEDAKTAAVTPLQTELTQLREKCTAMERTAQEKTNKTQELEQQLRNAMDGTKRMQSELTAERSERETLDAKTATLEREIEAALKELGSAKETVRTQSERIAGLEDESSRLATDKENLAQELREVLEKRAEMANAGWIGWNPSSELWLTSALTACGTAAAVSLVLMKYYSTL